MRTTYMAKPNAVERKWYVIDATGYRVGRLATEIAERCSVVNINLSLHLTWIPATSSS